MKKYNLPLKRIAAVLVIYLAGITFALPLAHLLRIDGSTFDFLRGIGRNAVNPDLGAHLVHQLAKRGIVSPTPRELKINSALFGAPAFLAFLLRMVNRVWVMKKLHWEDYLMCATVFLYISLLSLINVSALFATNLYPQNEAAAILADPEDIKNRIIGSKIVIALEQCMLFMTWGVKFCIWGFLRRVCRQLPTYERALKYLLCYLVASLALIELCYFVAFCHPFTQYWDVPVQNSQCATYAQYSILQAVFNMSSDLCLILIPIVMVSHHSQMPKSRRFVLGFVFSLGIFTIIAAILNKYFNFKSPMTTTYQLWYLREASVAVCVGNIICTWQLLQRLFRLRSWDNKSAGIQKEPEPQVGPNGTVPCTIGGTPRIIQETPAGAPSRRFFPKRKDPDASLFSTLMGRSKVERPQVVAVSFVNINEVVGGGSGYTSETYINERDRNSMGMGIVQPVEGCQNLQVPASQLMSLVRDGDDASHAIVFRRAEGIA